MTYFQMSEFWVKDQIIQSVVQTLRNIQSSASFVADFPLLKPNFFGCSNNAGKTNLEN